MPTPTNATTKPDLPKAIDWLRHLPGLLPFIIAITIVITVSLTLPGWLHQQQVDDLRGVPVQTSSGVVRQLLDNPGNPGGGSAFNAVTIDLGGRQVYWNLPPGSLWKPMIGEIVEVRYRIGKTGSHVIHVDSVQWGTEMDPQYRKPY